MLLRDDLQQQLRERPDRVVFVVGTGVVLGAVRGAPCEPYASWVGLIRSGLERAHALGKLPADELDDNVKKLGHTRLGALLETASAVEELLGAPKHGEFRRWLKETVGTFEANVRDGSVLDALAAHQRRKALLATTNYDLLLEQVTGLEAVTWRDIADVDGVLRGTDKPRILHLHGAWRWPDSVVLGIKSYADVARDSYAQTVLTALRTDRTFVFVGCGAGLRDPNLGAFLKWTAEVFNGSEARHFRLCRDSEVEAVRAEHPDGQRIFPLPYGPNHGDLAPFLRSLLPPGTASLPVSPPSHPSTTSTPTVVSQLAAQPATSVLSTLTPAATRPTTPIPPDRWEPALVQFFHDAFANSEIEQFFALSLGRELAGALPSAAIPHDEFCFKAVTVLRNRGSCDHAFFEALRLIRGQRRAEIDAIQLACLGTLAPPGPPPPPPPPPPDANAVTLPQFALVLDRTTQWLTLTTMLRDEPRHALVVVHGDNHQDIGLFVQRTLRWANGTMGERPPRSHEIIAVECYHEGKCPRNKSVWAARVSQAIALKHDPTPVADPTPATEERLRVALAELAGRAATLLVFVGQNGGGLRIGGEGMKMNERNAFADCLKDLVSALPSNPAHPIRLLVPIEHAPDMSAEDALLEASREASQAHPQLHYLPLQELDFPTWSEVRDSLRREIQRRKHRSSDRDLERLFRPTFNHHDGLKTSQAHSFAALGKALSEILERELPEEEDPA